jgi:phosphoribosylaminoimidazole carboxylase PurE protein
MTIKIGILLGSDSDFPVLEKGVALLKEFNIPFSIEVSSAHRTPQRTVDLIRQFEQQKVQVIIAAAGGAAHLPGVIAAHTLIPVLGIPVNSALSGVDSLYSIVQMPGGIPVATFGIGNSGGLNAVLFACQMLATTDEKIRQHLETFRQQQEQAVIEKSGKLKNKIDH